MKYLVCVLLVLGACKKKGGETEIVPAMPGGKGGAFHIAVFPLQGATGVSGKVFIKYGTKAAPASYSQYDDSSATMVEPGFGPHVHFLSLKPGFYAIAAYGVKDNALISNDTIIEIKSSQGPSTDYDLQLR